MDTGLETRDFDLSGLSEPERRLWMGFPYGTHIDLRTGDPEQDDPSCGEAWGADRIINADVVRAMLTGHRSVENGQSPSVLLSGARIAGQLDLRGLEVVPPVLFADCFFERELLVAGSIFGALRMYDCHLPGIDGAWMTAVGDLHVRGCQLNGPVDLTGAHLMGQLVLSASRLDNPGEVALRADGLVVDGDFLCRDEAVIDGEISLVAARVGGELRFTTSTLRNKGAVALRADRLTVEKDMFCRKDFAVFGGISLRGAHVKGQLNFNQATLRNPGEVALDADYLVVDSHLYLYDGFAVDGEIRLVAARVGGEVRFSASKWANQGGMALRADRLVVADDMYCRQNWEVLGAVSLRGAHVKGQLNFNNAALRNPGEVALDADQLVVGSHLYCHGGSVVEGEIRLVAARVGGEVRFSASKLANQDGMALRADRLAVSDDMFCREGLEIDGGVSLRGAHVKGQLNFNQAKLRNPGEVALDADQLAVGSHLYCHDGFSAQGEVRLVAARVGGEVRFSSSLLSNPRGTAFRAERLVVADDMYCRAGFRAEGEVVLSGADINGLLSFGTAQLSNPGGVALRAEQLAVGQHLYCNDGFVADGVIDLTDAHVGGEVSLCTATVRNAQQGPSAAAILAERLTVAQDMYCRDGFAVIGGVVLTGAHIAGLLSLASATLTGNGGPALAAAGLRVDLDMACHKLRSDGEITLYGAHIGKNLDFSGAEMHNPKGMALAGNDLQADRLLMPAKCEAGVISLRNAKLTELDDRLEVLPDRMELAGLSYDTLIPPMEVRDRLKWLRRGGKDFEPQPYEQLARSYRRLGYDDEAREVLLAKERHRRRDLGWTGKTWGLLQDATIGYGYRPWVAALWFAGLLALGMLVFGTHPPPPVDPNADVFFNVFFYTLDLLIPIAEFGQREFWNPTTGQQWFGSILAACGWILASTAVAGVARMINRP